MGILPQLPGQSLELAIPLQNLSDTVFGTIHGAQGERDRGQGGTGQRHGDHHFDQGYTSARTHRSAS